MKQVVIYVPGLNDTKLINKTPAKFLSLFWKVYGVKTHIFCPQWEKGNYKDKLEELIKCIDTLASKDSQLYLIGQSAGGSLVLNAFSQRKEAITGIINIGGRLKKGTCGFPLALAAKYSPAFKESVLTFENANSKTLTVKEKRKILIVRPIFDEIVPKETCDLDGVRVWTLPTIEHTLSGILACTIFSPVLFGFLKNTSKQ